MSITETAVICAVDAAYRKYYGWKMAGFLFATFYAVMATAALVVEAMFGAAGLIPREHEARVVEASIAWNYMTWLNMPSWLWLPSCCGDS